MARTGPAAAGKEREPGHSRQGTGYSSAIGAGRPSASRALQLHDPILNPSFVRRGWMHIMKPLFFHFERKKLYNLRWCSYGGCAVFTSPRRCYIDLVWPLAYSYAETRRERAPECDLPGTFHIFRGQEERTERILDAQMEVAKPCWCFGKDTITVPNMILFFQGFNQFPFPNFYLHFQWKRFLKTQSSFLIRKMRTNGKDWR